MKNSILQRIFNQGSINFWLTNRVPRRALTLFFGWFSQLEHPLIARLSIAVWRIFADDLNLEEAKKTTFRSLHDCFIRELKDQARPVEPDPSIVISPCDAIVGAMGTIRETELIQAKGFPYTLEDLLRIPQLVERYRNGRYVTLRLKSSMYHRFHAPCDCQIREISYISGDVWNVNPSALQRVERLFCKNERAIIPLEIPQLGPAITLVPVAAILVASIHLNFLNVRLNLKYRGSNRIDCKASFKKGMELGYFHHGSTIIVFGSREFQFCETVRSGSLIRMGQPLLCHAATLNSASQQA